MLLLAGIEYRFCLYIEHIKKFSYYVFKYRELFVL